MNILLIDNDPESSTGDGGYSLREILYTFIIPDDKNAKILYSQFWANPTAKMKKWNKETRYKKFVEWLRTQPGITELKDEQVSAWPGIDDSFGGV